MWTKSDIDQFKAEVAAGKGEGIIKVFTLCMMYSQVYVIYIIHSINRLLSIFLRRLAMAIS